MKITFLGHAALDIQTDTHRILVDPFISGNELATGKIDIGTTIRAVFTGDKRVLEDIELLAENGYGEDNSRPIEVPGQCTPPPTLTNRLSPL